MINYLGMNASNVTLECVQNVIDNVTITDCHGYIATIPTNSDLQTVLLVICTCCLVLLVILNLSRIVLK